MLSDVKGGGWSRGNFELVGEGFGSGIFEGDGSFISGVTVWLRYNFVPPGWRFVPFAQAGLGLTSTDIDHKIVGQPLNLNLELELATCFRNTGPSTLSIATNMFPMPIPVRITSGLMRTVPFWVCPTYS